jgi:ABC-type transporter Mla subunit MlaD
MGNRQLANQNTDDIYRNRYAILQNLSVADQVQENFRDAMLNKSKLDFLEHRSALNAKVIAVSEKMSAINTMLIEVNSMIMDGNAGIVEFNAKSIEVNDQLLSGGATLKDCTPDKNAKLIASNSDRLAKLSAKATANKKKIASLISKVEANGAKTLKNAEQISQRRKDILARHKKIASNQTKVAKIIKG